MLKTFFHRVKKSRLAGETMGWWFEHMSFSIPVNRLKETATLLAFRHPSPAYPVHVLIVPKKAVTGLQDLGQEDSPFLQDLFKVVGELVDDLKLAETGYRLIVNGGKYQEIPQLHFHLISGDTLPGEKT